MVQADPPGAAQPAEPLDVAARCVSVWGQSSPETAVHPPHLLHPPPPWARSGKTRLTVEPTCRRESPCQSGGEPSHAAAPLYRASSERGASVCGFSSLIICGHGLSSLEADAEMEVEYEPFIGTSARARPRRHGAEGKGKPGSQPPKLWLAAGTWAGAASLDPAGLDLCVLAWLVPICCPGKAAKAAPHGRTPETPADHLPCSQERKLPGRGLLQDGLRHVGGAQLMPLLGAAGWHPLVRPCSIPGHFHSVSCCWASSTPWLGRERTQLRWTVIISWSHVPLASSLSAPWHTSRFP